MSGFNFLDYASNEGIKLRRGTGPERILECPVCTKPYHLYYNTKNNLWFCQRCGEGGNHIRFIMIHKGVSLPEAIGIIEEGTTFSISAIRKRISSYIEKMSEDTLDYKMVVSPPLHSKPVSKGRYPKFFSSRGYDKKTVIFFQPRVCEKSPYFNRIIFPFSCDGHRSFVAYATNSYMEKKTLNPPGTRNSELIYGYDLWKKCKTLVVVEGLTDVIRLTHYGYYSNGLLGKNISDSHIHLLYKHPCEEICLCYDGDVWFEEKRKKKALENIDKLAKNVGKKLTLIQLKREDDDPDSLSEEEWDKLYNNRVTHSQFLRQQRLKSLLH